MTKTKRLDEDPEKSSQRVAIKKRGFAQIGSGPMTVGEGASEGKQVELGDRD